MQLHIVKIIVTKPHSFRFFIKNLPYISHNCEKVYRNQTDYNSVTRIYESRLQSLPKFPYKTG